VYHELDGKQIVATLERLGQRIAERFPGSGLSRVSQELLEVGRQSGRRVERLRRPWWSLRLLIAVLVLAIITLIGFALASVRVPMQVEHIADFLQGLDAAVNEIILLVLLLVFVGSLEGRFKRRQALHALHQLRSIAHVIDMHQLTKDPDVGIVPTLATPSSPRRTLNRFQLSRYLDYCSELLSLTSKLAALHVQYLRDPVVLNAVNDVETLADGLTQKIWQKITVLDAGLATQPPKEAGLHLPHPASG
jgi:hypothetical protein